MELATEYFTAVGCCSPRSMFGALHSDKPVDRFLGCGKFYPLFKPVRQEGILKISQFRHLAQAVGTGYQAVSRFEESKGNSQAVARLKS